MCSGDWYNHSSFPVRSLLSIPRTRQNGPGVCHTQTQPRSALGWPAHQLISRHKTIYLTYPAPLRIMAYVPDATHTSPTPSPSQLLRLTPEIRLRLYRYLGLATWNGQPYQFDFRGGSADCRTYGLPARPDRIPWPFDLLPHHLRRGGCLALLDEQLRCPAPRPCPATWAPLSWCSHRGVAPVTLSAQDRHQRSRLPQ